MSSVQKKFKKENTIAYDKNLRSQLKTIHDMLGEDVTDIASRAMEYGIEFHPKSQGVLKAISKLTSDLSVAILEAKDDKKKLSKVEQEDFEQVKTLTNLLGNLQFKINEVIKNIDKFNRVAEKLYEAGVSLAQDIMDSQEKFRMLRADFNAIGFLSDDPEISTLLDK